MSMNPRVKQLIHELRLQQHPEGGYFAETHRSRAKVTPEDGRGQRAALTTIYYLLEGGTFSRWHRVTSDEVWHWCEGDPLDLFLASPTADEVQIFELGPFSRNAEPVRVVPAGMWQAARTRSEYTLVSCSVGPGFDFSDFTLLAPLPESTWPMFIRNPAARQLL